MISKKLYPFAELNLTCPCTFELISLEAWTMISKVNYLLIWKSVDHRESEISCYYTAKGSRVLGHNLESSYRKYCIDLPSVNFHRHRPSPPSLVCPSVAGMLSKLSCCRRVIRSAYETKCCCTELSSKMTSEYSRHKSLVLKESQFRKGLIVARWFCCGTPRCRTPYQNCWLASAKVAASV